MSKNSAKTGWVRFVAVLSLLHVGAFAFAAPPSIKAIFPTGGQRGATVTATLSGDDLAGLSGFYTLGAGLSATVKPGADIKLGADGKPAGEAKPGADAKTRTVEIEIAPDAPLGIQQIRFFDVVNGLSNARFFRVGQWPEVNEAEPNDAIQNALKVAKLPVTVNGRITDNPDRDGVTFHARVGETIVCEVEGVRVLGQVGDSWLKGYLEICDTQTGESLVSSAGTSDDYYRWDGMIPFTPTKEGDYTVFFRDLNWRGAVNAVYRLHIGATPHATAIFPLAGRRNAGGATTAEVTFSGPNLPANASRSVSIPPDAADLLEVALESGAEKLATNARPFRVFDLPNEARQKGGNNSLQSAQTVPFPCLVNGRIARPDSPAKARDFYRFKLEKPQKVALEVFSRRVGTPMDPEITLFDAAGKTLQADDDARGRDCRIERDLPVGEFVVMVRDVDDRSGPEFPYSLILGGVTPGMRLAVSPDSPKLARGGKVELTVKVEREQGFDGDVTVTARGLPAGVTVAAPLTIAKGSGEGKLTLNAAFDAGLGPFRIEIVGAGTAGDKPLKAVARAQETYNIQGTAFQRDLLGPILFVTEK